MSVPKDPDMDLVCQIEARATELRQFFDLSRLEDSGSTAAKIRKYYEDSRVGYRLVHSRDGAMHMALNPDGSFDRAGYEGQSSLVADRFLPATTDVLELACGNGYNLGLLADQHDGKRFLGLDLVESQVERANQLLARHKNAHAVVGDFQELEFADDSSDLIFVIESLCHATDLEKALREVRRVLRPGGRFIVIDAWRTGEFDTFPQSVRDAAAYVERAMAVADAQQFPVWQRVAHAAGLRVTEDLDLTAQIMPNLERLARITKTRFLSHPLRARLLKRLVPGTLLTNAVSGYLIPLTVRIGAHTYRLVTLEHVE